MKQKEKIVYASLFKCEAWIALCEGEEFREKLNSLDPIAMDKWLIDSGYEDARLCGFYMHGRACFTNDEPAHLRNWWLIMEGAWNLRATSEQLGLPNDPMPSFETSQTLEPLLMAAYLRGKNHWRELADKYDREAQEAYNSLPDEDCPF